MQRGTELRTVVWEDTLKIGFECHRNGFARLK